MDNANTHPLLILPGSSVDAAVGFSDLAEPRAVGTRASGSPGGRSLPGGRVQRQPAPCRQAGLAGHAEPFAAGCCNQSRKSGFTIIELLASMTILVFIVIMMTRMFTESTQIWSLGTKRITTATEGRAIMDFMVNELTQAMADDVLTFKLNSGGVNAAPLYGVDAYGAESDEICYVAAVQAGRSGNKRNVDEFAYFIAPMIDEDENIMPNRFRLARTRRTTSMYLTQSNRDQAAYKDREWWRNMTPAAGYVEEANNTGQGCETIAENVAAFEVWAYSEALSDYNFGYDSADPANKDQLPLWLDVYLELLSEEDAIRAAILWDTDEDRAKAFVSQNAKRFTARVFFPNRERALAF